MILHDRDGKVRCRVAESPEALLMSTSRYRLYLATMMDSSDSTSKAKDVLLRIANGQFENGLINAEAELLKKIQNASNEIEEIVRNRGEPPVHYDWLVPQLEATFITEKSQDGRQANILSFPDVAVTELFPLPKLKEYCMIDCKTATWILGRYFKLQSFLDLLGEQVILASDQVLIHPSLHRLIFLGFINKQSNIRKNGKGRTAKDNITNVVVDTYNWIEPEQLCQEKEFKALLESFATLTYPQHTAGEMAHQELYSWVRKNWGKQYHPFTYFVKDEQIWKHDNTPILT